MARSLGSFVLAVSLSLGSLGSVAQACGGYGPLLTADVRARIEDTLTRHFFVRFDDPGFRVDDVVLLDDGLAEAWLTFDDGTSRAVMLRSTERGWQVASE